MRDGRDEDELELELSLSYEDECEMLLSKGFQFTIPFRCDLLAFTYTTL